MSEALDKREMPCSVQGKRRTKENTLRRCRENSIQKKNALQRCGESSTRKRTALRRCRERETKEEKNKTST